jgi:adenosylcobinamide-GDP ribazoletransferase
MEYARAEGKAKPMAQQMSGREFGIAALTALLPAALLAISGAVSLTMIGASLLAAALATIWFARLFQRRIGGYTGDCLGAVQQLAEVAIYLTILASLGQGALR